MEKIYKYSKKQFWITLLITIGILIITYLWVYHFFGVLCVLLLIVLVIGIYLEFFGRRARELVLTETQFCVRWRGELEYTIYWKNVDAIIHDHYGSMSSRITILSHADQYQIEGDLKNFNDFCRTVYFHVKKEKEEKKIDVIIDSWFIEKFGERK